MPALLQRAEDTRLLYPLKVVSILGEVGWGKNTGLSLGADLKFKNFFGTGNQVILGVKSTKSALTASLSHVDPFYTDYGVNIQKQFFDYYLKGKENGWQDRPKVNLLTRYPNEVFKENYYSSWPLEETDWRKAYLNASNLSIDQHNPKELSLIHI